MKNDGPTDTVSNPTSNQIIKFFKGRCVICGHPACVVHEIEPRSRGNNALRFDNRIAICNSCHEFAHEQGITKKTIETMQFIRENRIKSLYGDSPPLIEEFA